VIPRASTIFLRSPNLPGVGCDAERRAELSAVRWAQSTLIDTLLVFIIRRWLDDQPIDGAGWFGALRDPQIGQALALIHAAPHHRWTVAELASRVAKSRAAFARRFVALVGESPLAYVTRWRLNLAAKLLRSTADSVEVIGVSVGYQSPTAFGNAFRRHFALSPGQYRLGARIASDSLPATSANR